jgi:hypothetical protein
VLWYSDLWSDNVVSTMSFKSQRALSSLLRFDWFADIYAKLSIKLIV